MPADLATLESLFLGLADKTRLRLLALMAAGPVSVGHLVSETGDSQPKISRHLAYLRNAGLVDTTRDGKWIYYGLADLKDAAADSVFRCVVDELGGKSLVPGSAQTRRPSEPTTVQASEPSESLERSYYQPELEPEEAEWDHPSEEAHNELDVFLL